MYQCWRTRRDRWTTKTPARLFVGGLMRGVCVPARTPHYQKFNAQILTLGVLTGFSLWPHAWGNHLVDHGIPYARKHNSREKLASPSGSPLIPSNDPITGTRVSPFEQPFTTLFVRIGHVPGH
ncbi:hypothetical protein K0M31_004588 [Melipona bicolor]|uniref:Uncharacterized protein n=1 Tax=Melipona bicolor TaxID=60889 RepID=A0AA40FX35_9HYME|nr:hypothetical protein K0M31_004588 [Melipona bicolor]